MRKEWLARILVVLLLATAIGIPAMAARSRSHGIVIHARMAETGGWTPENLTVAVGQPLRIRLTSDDVMHGFAIGKSDQPAVDVKPGEMTDLTLVFDRPGKYTFYCTRWCSVNHWRMRGTIEVTGPETTPDTVKPPLYTTLGLDIDSRRQADSVPKQKPSGVRGAALAADPSLNLILKGYSGTDYYLAHSPLELWNALRSNRIFKNYTDQDIWDITAWIWQTNATHQARQVGAQLYATNCAACHGEKGDGNGVFADQFAAGSENVHGDQTLGEQTLRPADFTDPSRMLTASPPQLQGKILRGGMGTGMPYWGPIFTEEQTWALVAYLWTFQFRMEKIP